MVITKIQIWQRLNDMGVSKTLTEVETALSEVDTESIFNTERAKYKIEVWDKVSPINGISASKILERTDIPEGGEIYLIYINNQLVYLQPHDPFQAGLVPLTSENVLDIANRHIDQLAWQAANEKIFETVLEKLV